MLGNCGASMADLGMRMSADEVFPHTTVCPDRIVEVTLADPNEAKIAADLVAAELKRTYSEMIVSQVAQDCEFLESKPRTSRGGVCKAYEEVDRLKRGSSKSADIAIAQKLRRNRPWATVSSFRTTTTAQS